MKLRTILFWAHLTAGVVAGSVILNMSVTGALLTFQQTVLRIVERSQRTVVPPGPDARRLDADLLLARVREGVPGAHPMTVTLESDPHVAVAVALGTQGTVFVDPYTGAIRGFGSVRARAFYRTVTSWHRYLGVEGERRATARAITGACNAAFLVLAVTGLYLWWPRRLLARQVKAVVLFRRGLRGKARDFNWHNVIGFWCAPVIVVLTATGMVISYTWASNLVYTITGSPRPAASGTGGAAGSRAARQSSENPAGARPSLESVVARAQREVPTWRTLIVRVPPRPEGAITVSVSNRNHWNSFARSTLTVNGDVRWEPYAQASAGQKLRGWMRFAHTGELGGLAGEAVAGLASAGGAFLVWTGVSLALRRAAAWRSRKRLIPVRETREARVA
jgi:uncharacterized iron-regulated membrane protein